MRLVDKQTVVDAMIKYYSDIMTLDQTISDAELVKAIKYAMQYELNHDPKCKNYKTFNEQYQAFRHMFLPGYDGPIARLFKMMLHLKNIDTKINIDSTQYDLNLYNDNIKLTDELNLKSSNDWPEYVYDLLFSLDGILLDKQGNKTMRQIAQKINWFYTAEMIRIKSAQIELVPTDGLGIEQDIDSTLKQRFLRGLLFMYQQNQNFDVSDWLKTTPKLGIPDYSDTYGNKTDFHNILAATLYLHGEIGAFDDLKSAWENFQHVTLDSLDDIYLPDVIIRKLFTIDDLDAYVTSNFYASGYLGDYLHGTGPTTSYAVQAGYINNKALEESEEPLFLEQYTGSVTNVYKVTMNKWRHYEMSSDNLVATFQNDYAGHTQTLIPAYPNQQDYWFIGTQGQTLGNSQINWAQNISRVKLTDKPISYDSFENGSGLATLTHLNRDDLAIKRIEACITPDYKWLITIGTDMQNILSINKYKLSDINNSLQPSSEFDIRKLKPESSFYVNTADNNYAKFNKWLPSIQGFSVDNDLNIYITCQKAPLDNRTIGSEPRSLIIVPWNTNNISQDKQVKIIDLDKQFLPLVPDDPEKFKNYMHLPTELEGLQYLDKHTVRLFVTYHFYKATVNGISMQQDVNSIFDLTWGELE